MFGDVEKASWWTRIGFFEGRGQQVEFKIGPSCHFPYVLAVGRERLCLHLPAADSVCLWDLC